MFKLHSSISSLTQSSLWLMTGFLPGVLLGALVMSLPEQGLKNVPKSLADLVFYSNQKGHLVFWLEKTAKTIFGNTHKHREGKNFPCISKVVAPSLTVPALYKASLLL